MDIDILGSTDAQLHECWRRGDARAAAQLVVRYRSRLQSLGLVLGLSEIDADELAQQVLVDAPASRFEQRPNCDYFDWLCAIARRKAARMFARDVGELPVRRPTTPRTAIWRGAVLESVEQMPAHLREVFVRLMVGYTSNEIASELELDATTVRMRIHRGRQWLRSLGH